MFWVLGTFCLVFSISYVQCMHVLVGQGILVMALLSWSVAAWQRGGRVDPLTYTTQGTMPKRYRGFLNWSYQIFNTRTNFAVTANGCWQSTPFPYHFAIFMCQSEHNQEYPVLPMLDMWKRPSKLSVFWKSILFGICLDKWQKWFRSKQSSHKVDVALFAKVVFIFHCGLFCTFAGKLWRWAQRSRRWTRWSWRWKLRSRDPGSHRPTPGALQNSEEDMASEEENYNFSLS